MKVYSLNEIQEIKENINSFCLDNEVNDTLHNLCNLLGLSNVTIKQKQIRKERILTNENNIWKKQEPFKTTVFEKKEGVDSLLNNLRGVLNKISKKNYLEQEEQIQKIINEIIEFNENEVDNIDEKFNKIFNVFYRVLINNKVHTNLYAQLFNFFCEEYYQFEDFIDVLIERYLSQIDFNKANNEINTNWENHHKDTVYLTVIDKNRQMVSLIFSIFNSFGSGYASEKFGLLFHNRGAGFTLESGHPNELVGNKRPLHTIIPAFLKKDDEFIMPFGVMGGQYQANGHARLVSNIIDYGMDIQTAIDFPRSFPENGYLKLEEGYPEKIAKDLEKMGHKILRPDQPVGGAQAIIYDMKNDILIGGSDPRKDGCALGY